MQSLLPHTPRHIHPPPAPLTRRAETRNVASLAVLGWLHSTNGCRVQRFSKCCTDVAPNVAVNIKQNQGFSSKVQRCNGFSPFCLTCVRAHTPTRAREANNTVAPLHLLHLLYKPLILLVEISATLVQQFCPMLQLATLRICKTLAIVCLKICKSLFSLNNPSKPIVYWGITA